MMWEAATKNEKKLTGFPSIDKPWLKYFTEEDLKIKAPECTIYQNIYDRNKDHLDDIAIRFYGNYINYKQLFQNVEMCAKSLCSIGIKQGDCVNLCTASVPEAIYVALACSRVGAIANFINPLFSKEQMIARINDTEAEWILILDAMYGYIKDALPATTIKNVVIIPVTNSIPKLASKLLWLKSNARKIMNEKSNCEQQLFLWKEFLLKGENYQGGIDAPYERDTACIMVYSSGSTGASKGIMLTNYGINSTISYYMRRSFSYDRGDTFLQMIPIWFSTGIVLSILMPLTLGITVIPELKFSKEQFLNDIREKMPSMTLTATSLWLYVMNSPEGYNLDFSRMTYPITGGEKLLSKDEKQLNTFLRKHMCKSGLYKGYGMCELGGTIASSSNDVGYKYKCGGTGFPILGVIVSAFDIDTDEELKYGEHGEIRVCSPARMKGYYKNPEATEDFFKTDVQGRVWGCTGDIGYVDEDGEVFILGRATDHYRRENGEIVYLFDIENVVLQDDAVNQCKVVNIEIDGKYALVCHLVLRKKGADTNAVLKRIYERMHIELPDYMIPEYYKFRDSMPVHPNGKRDVDALAAEKNGLQSFRAVT